MSKLNFKNEGDDLYISIDDTPFRSLLELKGLDLLLQKKILEILADKFVFMNRLVLRPYDFRLPKYLLKSLPMTEVTFFGGTFNPIHEGHMACLRLCPSDHIIILPDRNPHKELRNFNPLDEFIDLVQLFKDGPYSIYPGFWAKETPNPTSDWFNKVLIKKRNLLMGDDSFIGLKTWGQFENILKGMSTLYVAPRKHSEEKLQQCASEYKNIHPDLAIVFLSDHEFKHLSSTEIRKNRFL